jgi:hypothetical protein
MLVLLIALSAASIASAQNVTPGGDVYVKDFVQGDGNTNVDNDSAGDCESSGGTNNSGGGDESCDTEVVADCADGASVDSTTGQPCSVATVTTGDLPFTGFEAGLVALAGLALLGAGFGMRRMTRSNGSAP